METGEAEGEMSESETGAVHTIPLRKAWLAPPHRRAVRAMHMIRDYAKKHMKSEDVKIDAKVSELVWSKGIEHIPRRITVRLSKDEEERVTVALPD